MQLNGDIPGPPARASHRSKDGSDLPARVGALIEAWNETHLGPPTQVWMGELEIRELCVILLHEIPKLHASGIPWDNLHVAGLKVMRTSDQSRLELH